MPDAMKEARLPKWAQAELANLRRRLEDAEDEVAELRLGFAGPEDTDTYADPYGSSPINLPKGGIIAFRIGYGEEDVVHARVTHEGLDLNGMRGLVAIPRASNSFVIGVRRD